MPKADSSNTTILSRRALMLTSPGLVTANVAAAAIAVGCARVGTGGSDRAEADAQLFTCWREYLKLEIELNAVQEARDQMSWNARQSYPPKPDCIAIGRVKVTPFEFTPDVEVCAATMDMKSGRQPAAESKAAVEAWQQKCNDIDIQFGLPELESAFKSAWDRQWAAFAHFIATPAKSLAGLAVKTSAIFYFDDKTRRAWQGIVIDQKRLEPEQQILLTLRRDLLRLAGLPDDFAMEFSESHEQYFGSAEWSESVSQV
jgi:hypothetical protein